MRREGILLDPKPAALTAVRFDLDILSDHYTALATNGEQWCVELEVYHNSLAAHRFVLDLLPGATHWFEVDGELRLHNMGATGAVIDNTAHQFAIERLNSGWLNRQK